MKKNELSKLTTLASEINEAHRLVEDAKAATVAAARATVEHAIRAGHKLNEAKTAIPHGGWGKWIADNLECSDRTVRVYCQLADNAGLIEQEAPATIQKALTLIAEPKPDSKSADVCRFPRKPFRERPEEWRRKWVRTDWGWREACEQVYLLNSMGRTMDEIAEITTLEPSEVEACLFPQIPVRFNNQWNAAPVEDWEELGERWNKSVEYHIYSILAHTLDDMNRDWFAEREDVPPDVMQEINITARMLKRREEALEPYYEFRNPIFADDESNIVWSVMASGDARAALGICSVESPGELLTHWSEFHESRENRSTMEPFYEERSVASEIEGDF